MPGYNDELDRKLKQLKERLDAAGKALRQAREGAGAMQQQVQPGERAGELPPAPPAVPFGALLAPEDTWRAKALGVALNAGERVVDDGA